MNEPPPLQIVLQLLFQFLLIGLNAIFACAEIAVIETKGTKLDKLAEDGNKRAKVLKKLTENPAKFLATIQVAITLSGFLGSAFAAESFSAYIVAALSGKIGLPDGVIDTMAVIVITIVLSYITLVFGELVPKRLAMKNAEGISLRLSGTLAFVAGVFRPLVWLLTVSTNGVLRMLHIQPDEDDVNISEEDIRMLADAGSEKGIIDAEENEMIQNVFEFDNISVGEICTHRTEMTVLWEDDSDEDWKMTVKENSYAYFPICGEDIDHVVGMLDSNKYLRLQDRSRESVLREAVTKPRFVAQAMKADALFRDMKKTKGTVAIVVDEYGGTLGLITMNVLIEQIVGDLDESADEGDVVQSGDGYTIAGTADRESFDELFDIDTGSDTATIGGWVMEKMEKIPEPGDELEAEGVKITVTKADDKRVLEVYAEKLPEPEQEPEE